jgi:hypothetical protein
MFVVEAGPPGGGQAAGVIRIPNVGVAGAAVLREAV